MQDVNHSLILSTVYWFHISGAAERDVFVSFAHSDSAPDNSRACLGRNRVAPNSTSYLSWGWLARPVLASRLRSRAAPGVVNRHQLGTYL